MISRRTLLTIVRHGQTSANVEKVWHGSIDTPLTNHGRRQAEATAAWIETHHQPIRSVYSSPLDRAHHTARLIAERFDLAPTLDRDLAEYDLGDWEGLPFSTLWKERRLFQNMAVDPDYRPHGGESPRQVGDRLAGALRRIAARHPDERVVVVTHGGALSIAFGLLLEGKYDEWSHMMKNAAISELALEPRPELLSFNQTDHLPDES